MAAMGHAHLEDRGACGKALSDLGSEGQVLESGVVVVQVQQVDKNRGAAGSSQGWPPACGGQERGLKVNASSCFQPFPLKRSPHSLCRQQHRMGLPPPGINLSVLPLALQPIRLTAQSPGRGKLSLAAGMQGRPMATCACS